MYLKCHPLTIVDKFWNFEVQHMEAVCQMCLGKSIIIFYFVTTFWLTLITPTHLSISRNRSGGEEGVNRVSIFFYVTLNSDHITFL